MTRVERKKRQDSLAPPSRVMHHSRGPVSPMTKGSRFEVQLLGASLPGTGWAWSSCRCWTERQARGGRCGLEGEGFAKGRNDRQALGYLLEDGGIVRKLGWMNSTQLMFDGLGAWEWSFPWAGGQDRRRGDTQKPWMGNGKFPRVCPYPSSPTFSAGAERLLLDRLTAV